MSSITSVRGFTLFETVIAAGILVTALAGIGELFVLSTHLTRRASASGFALVAAQDKIEWLRGRTFAYDDAGAAITSHALQPSSSSSLDADVEGNVDWIGVDGNATDNAAGASFVRRWRTTLVASDPDAIAIDVCVFTSPAEGVDHGAADACLSAVRTRQP